MLKQAGAGDRTRNAAQGAPLLSVALLCALALSSLSCSIQKRHQVLAFFFDDVPPIDAGAASGEPAEQAGGSSAATEEETTVRRPAAPQGSQHQPYAAKPKRCSTCHGSEYSMAVVADEKSVCAMCHEGFIKPFRYVHGPAARMECQVCHSPHESELPHLLLRREPDLCLWCHAESDVRKAEYHKDVGDRRCTECHNPHGGDNRMFLAEAPSGSPDATAAGPAQEGN